MTENLMDNQEDNFQIDPNVSYRDQLVGEGKKFKTDEDMAKGKAQADHYITILEKRLDAITEDYKKVSEERNVAPKLQELLDKIDSLQTPASRANPESNEDKSALDLQQVESLVSTKYAQLRQTERETENFNAVKVKLQEKFGSNYKNSLKEQSEVLGLTDDEVNSMARKNPNLFYKTFDLTPTTTHQTFQSPPRSDVRSSSFAPKGAEKRTLAYYERLRRDNPMLYLDKKTAVQMDKDAQELGEAFFDV